MDLHELEQLFDDNDEEILDVVNELRTYSVKERKDHFNECNDEEFLKRFRFTKNIVLTIILPQIEHLLIHENARYHEIDPLNQLLITLRFYATGSFYIVMGDFVGIYKTTAGRIIKRVTHALVSLRLLYIKFPEEEESKRHIQACFFELAGFPKVIGAIDCTHIKIQSPGGNNAEYFRNRKGYFSLNVQVVCDSQNLILDIVARWPGSCHDSHIFQNSSIQRRFEAGEFGEAVPLGDSGYPLRDYLMTPLGNPVTRVENRYNTAHISTRTVVERTFGIMKRRFPVLSQGMRCKVPLTQEIIVAAAVLHNIAVKNRQEVPPAPDHIEELEDIRMQAQNMPNNFNFVQQRYLNYFRALL